MTQVFQCLEDCCDACEDVVDIVESIIMKIYSKIFQYFLPDRLSAVYWYYQDTD